jgi:hypothetical protein
MRRGIVFTLEAAFLLAAVMLAVAGVVVIMQNQRVPSQGLAEAQLVAFDMCNASAFSDPSTVQPPDNYEVKASADCTGGRAFVPFPCSSLASRGGLCRK